MTPEEPLEILWSEEERQRQKKTNPIINAPLLDELDTKLTTRIMANEFMRKYTVVWDDYTGGVYIHNGSFWQSISKDYLCSLAINCDTINHTTDARRTATVKHVLAQVHQLQVNWNRIKTEEVPLKDCVFNIHTNEKRPHSWEDYLDSVIPHKYCSWKKCDNWLKCLDIWFETEDKKLALQEFFGYILCSHVMYKKALLLWGESNTGKSVVCEVAKEMVGRIATCSIQPEKMDDPQLIAELKGKKLNIVTELSSGSSIADGGFKQIISGEPVQGNAKYKTVSTFVPIAKHVFATNVLPRLNDESEGVLNRLLLLKFNNVLDKEKQDPLLIEKLKEEVEGIVVWALAGLRRLMTNNGQFTIPSETVSIMGDYKITQNFVLDFIKNSGIVEEEAGGKVAIEVFVEHLNKYCGGKPLSNIQVGKKMSKLGFKSSTSGGIRYYEGLKIKGIKKNIKNNVININDNVPNNFFGDMPDF